MELDAGPAPRFVMDRCTPEERARAEKIVREGVQGRDPAENWLVSLHRFHDGWDLFIDGPDPGAVESIRERLSRAGFSR